MNQRCSGLAYELFAQIILLSFFSVISFYHMSDLLFLSNDGPTLLSHIEEQQYFFGITPHLYSNLLEGLTNLTYPLNVSLLPVFWLVDLKNLTPFSIAIIYAWFSVQLFISAIILGWVYEFSPRINYLAGWLLVVLFFPIYLSIRIYPITSTTPVIVCQVTAFALMCAGMKYIGRNGWKSTLFYSCIFLAGLLVELVVAPASFILIGPALFIMAISAFANVRSRVEFKLKLLIMISFLLLSFALGWIHLFLGLILDSSASYFNQDFSVSPTNLINISLFYHAGFLGYESGFWLFCASALGCCLALGNPKLKPLAVTVLTFQAIIAVIGAMPGVLDRWSGPTPIYCEVAFFPLYSLFTIYLMSKIIERMPVKLVALYKYNYSIQFVLLLVFTGMVLNQEIATDPTYRFNVTPSSSKITDVLEKKIAMYHGALFSGRVANVLPKKSWLEQFQISTELNNQGGNDHHSTGFWLKHIPTLHEYNQLITPAYYFFYRQLLSDGSDKPVRSWTNYNMLNERILKLLGVSYVLTTMPDVQSAKRVAMLNSVNKEHILYLHQLGHPNTGGVSVSSLRYLPSYRAAIDLMRSDEFDVSTALVVGQPIITKLKLQPVVDSKIYIIKGGMRLKAESNGESMLILPIEFSSCLHVKVMDGKDPELLRVDVALTGIRFNRVVDVILAMRTGPFANPKCRWNDYLEWKNTFGA